MLTHETRETFWVSVRLSMDINECDTSNGGCDQTCTNSIGSYECSCTTGYTLNANKHNCDDIPDCATANGGCEQICTETPGSYVCSCNPGYTLNTALCPVVCTGESESESCAESDCGAVPYHTCNDINECADSTTHNCAETCVNSPGGYTCKCALPKVLAADGASCIVQPKCTSAVDLAIILDHSSNPSDASFLATKNAIKDLLDRFTIGGSNARVMIISYWDKGRFNSKLNQDLTATALKTIVDGITKVSSSTARADLATKKAWKVGYTTTSGDRSSVPNAAILFGDAYTGTTAMLTKHSNFLFGLPTNTFAVGTGSSLGFLHSAFTGGNSANQKLLSDNAFNIASIASSLCA